jgi:glutathione peroxidase
MFSKIEVNGPGACELYAWLREQTGGGDIQWNFEKFLVDGDGNVVGRFAPTVVPDDPAIVSAIESALG